MAARPPPPPPVPSASQVSAESPPTVGIFVKFAGGGGAQEMALEIDMNISLMQLKGIITQSKPNITISRIMYSGRILTDAQNDQSLSNLGFYKECAIQCICRARNDSDPVYPLPNAARMRRRVTEEIIQFGDVIMIHLTRGQSLRVRSPCVMFQYGAQMQISSAQSSSEWNETFGFYIPLQNGRMLTDDIVISVADGAPGSPTGSTQLRVGELARDEKTDVTVAVANGEIQLQLQRHVLTSPDLVQTLNNIVSQQCSWTRGLLQQHNVSMGTFLGTEPWVLPGDNRNPALTVLTQILFANQIRFQNPATVDKVGRILRSQGVVVTKDKPSPVLYLSDLSVNEQEMVQFLEAEVPNGIKSLFYTEPIISVMESAASEARYCVVQFKNALTAAKALVRMHANSLSFLAGFGLPKEPNDTGEVSTSCMIQGFLQISTPQFRNEVMEQEPVSPVSDGEHLALSPSSKDAPYLWVKIADECFRGYLRLQGDEMAFQLAVTETQLTRTGPTTLDIYDLGSRETFNVRASTGAIMDMWFNTLLRVQEGSLSNDNLTMDDSHRSSDRWVQQQCFLSKEVLPLYRLYSPDGHKWFGARRQLNKYVKSYLSKNQLDMITTRFTVSDLKDLLSGEDFDDYSERSLQALIDATPNLVKCPNCNTGVEIEPTNPREHRPEIQAMMAKIRDLDTAEVVQFSPAARENFLAHRIRCRNVRCKEAFCGKCLEMPYHVGKTCEEYRATQSAERCRFCDCVLTDGNRIPNPISRSLADVCTKSRCVELMQTASKEVLECGHYCLGHKDETSNTPCLVDGCPSKPAEIQAHSTELCSLCHVDELQRMPVVILPCYHVFHWDCVKTRLEARWPKAYISWEFSQCPLCREPVEHETLAQWLTPLREMENEVRQQGLQRLKYEGLENHPDIVEAEGRFHNDQVGFAEHHYAFFLCHECQKPYFGGAKECGGDSDEPPPDPSELICGRCQNIESIDECKEHGAEYLAHKCRYCCNMSIYHCWGKVHFCRDCHQPGVWDTLSTYSTGKNKKGYQEYQQCAALEDQIRAVMSGGDWNTLNESEQEKKLYGCRADPELCELSVPHPPNGFEFGLGCTLCADKKTEEENQMAKARAQEEARAHAARVMQFMSNVESGTQFMHQYPFDENGILYFFGTKGKTAAYQNPCRQGMVIVTTSEMMPDSEPMSAFIGRSAVRCVTKPSASCWFAVDMIDKYVRATHYTLRHYISWDTECLRNWVIEGSIDGERWLVIRQHQNDQQLNWKGQAYTWALHDYGCAFRRFRVKQTGPNNNNHYFLACSGFEVYGALHTVQDEALIERDFTRAYTEQQQMKGASLNRFYDMMLSGQSGVYTFTYEDDFDESGILYFLGSRSGEWNNPALMDEVAVCSSALVKDSVGIEFFVGRSVERLVTRPEDNAWMQVDFKDKLIQPTYYTLRHYSSWDTECLRNWVLQASNDGIHWVVVKKHDNDQSLNEKGAAHTWPIQSRGAYRIWRIKQTGPNSNKHKYLSCSGIEFYGQLYLQKFDPLAGVANRVECERILNQLRQVHEAQFQQDNDRNGVIYWIGTRGGTSQWVNPGARGWTDCRASSLMRDSEQPWSLCGRIAVRCVTQPVENSWFVVDLKNLYVTPTMYSLRHYISWDTEALRNWIFEGSFDGRSWVTIRAHRGDEGIKKKGQVVSWEVRAKGARYRAFRIRQIGPNSNRHFYLSLSGFEVYGTVYQIGHPAGRAPQVQTSAPGESATAGGDAFDASLSGLVPWDNTPVNDNSGAENTASGVASEENQDFAILREIARQEKQRLIHHLQSGNGYAFHYASDFDEGGILYFLGTDWRTAPWRNPAEAGTVTVTSSRLAKDSAPASAIVGRRTVRCVCVAEKNNWFMIDFRNIFVRPTHYSLKHYSSWDTECLRNWVLEASNDLRKFKLLREHKKDKSLFGKGSTHTWPLNTSGKRYRAFRIRQFGPNSNKHWYLSLSGVEFYGETFFEAAPARSGGSRRG